MNNFSGQHVVVVGGSSGIGLAVGRQALASGAQLTLMARDPARLQQAAGSCGGPVATVAVDVTDPHAVQVAFDGIERPDHVYVAAAGFVGGSVLDTPLAELRAALEARLWGAVHVVRAAAPRMRERGGSFVLTGGVSSDRPAPGAWPTAVATAAAEQLARCLALELPPLRFNAIAPGWTDTPMWDALLGADKAATFASVAARLPVGRLATADEAAQAVLVLMANGSINAEVLHVDGGHRLV